MGMALPALSGELMPERTRHDVSRLLSIRHAGSRRARGARAPDLGEPHHHGRRGPRAGTAAVLDAPLPPRTRSRSRPSSSAASTPTIPAASSSPRSTTRARASTAMRRGARQPGRATRRRGDGRGPLGVPNDLHRHAGLALVALVLLWGALAPAGASGGRRLPRPLSPLCSRPRATGSPSPIQSARRSRSAIPARTATSPTAAGSPGRSSRSPRRARPGGATSAPVARSSCSPFDDRLQEEFEEEHGVNPRSPAVLGPALLGL